jgi:hypothetical protein
VECSRVLNGEKAPRCAYIVKRTELQQKALFTLVGLGQCYTAHGTRGWPTGPVFEQGITPVSVPKVPLEWFMYLGPLVRNMDYGPFIYHSVRLSSIVHFTV